MPGIALAVHHALVAQVLQELPQRMAAAEPLVGMERQLERRATHVIEQHQQLVGVDARAARARRRERNPGCARCTDPAARCRRPARRARCVAPPGATETLPGRRDAARIAVQHADIEAADIDAELQRRGADHAIDAAVTQAPLGLAALRRQVAAAIGEHARRPARVPVEHVLQVLGQHLDHQPRAREHDALETDPRGQTRDAIALRARRGTQPQVGIDHRRIPQQQPALALRRAAARHRGDVLAEQPVASSTGLAMVAEQNTNCGAAP